uniref:carboxypeptidase-like regulatory domain-containing protein n=1 Tax=Daejeonella sp. TaxID=2805397 RepID=UPI004049DC0B
MLFLKNIFLTCFLLLFFSINSKSQDNYTINGIVKDSLSGETLIGVTLKFNGKTQVGTSTNAYGFFSYKLSSGDYDLSVSYVGYRTINRRISVIADTKLDLNMVPDNILDEVVISSEKRNDNVVNAQMGVAKINLSEIRNVPVLFGERDILKTLQLLPGIKSAGEG